MIGKSFKHCGSTWIRDTRWGVNHFTLSDTHSFNFFKFCSGCHEIYYLWKHLEFKPDLVAAAWRSLYRKRWQACLCNQLCIQMQADKDSVIVQALCTLRTSHMEVELWKQKLALMQHQEELLVKEAEHLQKEEVQKATENLFKQQEKSCKATEHLFKHQEEAQRSSEHLFKQQEEMLQNISSSNRKKHVRPESISLMNGSMPNLILENSAKLREVKWMKCWSVIWKLILLLWLTEKISFLPS